MVAAFKHMMGFMKLLLDANIAPKSEERALQVEKYPGLVQQEGVDEDEDNDDGWTGEVHDSFDSRARGDSERGPEVERVSIEDQSDSGRDTSDAGGTGEDTSDAAMNSEMVGLDSQVLFKEGIRRSDVGGQGELKVPKGAEEEEVRVRKFLKVWLDSTMHGLPSACLRNERSGEP